MPPCANPEQVNARPARLRLRAWLNTAGAIACALPLGVGAVSAAGEPSAAAGLTPPLEASPSPGAASSLTPASAEGQQLLIVDIHLNGVAKGEFTVISTQGGDFLVGESDLQAMGVQPPYGTPLAVEGQAHFSLRGLKPGELRFDEGKLTLFVSLPPERLPRKALDLQPQQPQQALEPRDNSAFFNYRTLYTGDTAGGAKNLALATELGVRTGDFLLRAESSHSRSGGASQHIRYSTSLTHDNRRTLQRWIVGDFSAASGDLGSVLNLGGISFSKSYQINPYLIRQPMASFVGNIASPAQAEIYLDGVRVRTATLQPGQFELRNLNYYGGQREVSVVIRDRFGREQTLLYPFYFTDANLGAGLHDYSYNLGFQRQNLGVESNDYGPLAFSAFHRYGASDSLTLGGRGEAEPGRFNLGATAAWRLNTLGVVSGTLAAGRNRVGSGWAGVLRYAYQARQFNGQAELRRTSPHYQTLGQAVGADRPKTELSASASYNTAQIGSLSLGWHRRQQYDGKDQRSVSLGYSRTLFGALSLQASISQTTDSTSPAASTQFLLALSYSPRRDVTTSFFHAQGAGSTSDVLQWGTNTPVGEGVGYRVASERNQDDLGNSYRISPSLQYNGVHGVYTADLLLSRGTGGLTQQAYQLSMAGGIAYVGGTLALSRPVTDSFGLVKVGELQGVRVYHSAQEIGRTDASGKVFIPSLGSYLANRVAIDDRDIPIDYVIADKELNISPPLRSGSLIRFDVQRLQVITGRLFIQVAGQAQAAEYINLLITADGKEVSVPTGRGGELYIENLKPGRHAARFVFGEQRCAFELSVPPSQEMVIDLGELHVCQFDR